MLNYRKIEPADDKRIAEIIRANLEKFHLDIPGTAYFDPELDHLSAYYNSSRGGAPILSRSPQTDRLSAVSALPNLTG